MNGKFPFLVGRSALTADWSIDLPLACKQRFEESQMVLWRPGLTIWLSSWRNDAKNSIETRRQKFSEAASPGKFDEATSENAELCYYSYRIEEPSSDKRVPAFQGFAFADHGHLQLSIYFDDEADAELASSVLRSCSPEPPEIEDVSVLSKSCFATNAVMEEGAQVGYMYREQPSSAEDSGWRFFSGQESQDYVEDPSNTQIYPVALVAEQDRTVIPYLAAQNGQFGRRGNQFYPE